MGTHSQYERCEVSVGNGQLTVASHADVAGAFHTCLLCLLQNPRSNSRQVTLKQVAIRSSGMYRCEVSGEAPYFHSAHGEARMEVVCKYTL